MILPKYWSIERNASNYAVINKWMNTRHNTDGIYNNYTDKVGKVNNKNLTKSADGLPLISFEEFQQYILNEQPASTVNNLYSIY